MDFSPGTPEEIVEQIKECGKGQLPRLAWEGSTSIKLESGPHAQQGQRGAAIASPQEHAR